MFVLMVGMDGDGDFVNDLVLLVVNVVCVWILGVEVSVEVEWDGL